MIILENVSKSYSAGAPAVNNVSIHIKKGEFVSRKKDMIGSVNRVSF